MRWVHDKPDELVRITVKHLTRIPGHGEGHLCTGVGSYQIEVTETTLDEVRGIIEKAISEKCFKGGK